jgi:pimeloyl-ACP methyl ester carboxylesterase
MSNAIDLMIPGGAGSLSVRTKGLELKPSHVVVLVQGANLSGQTGFDLSIAGHRDYSMMDLLVEHGIGAVTFSIRGYAKSSVPADPLTINTDAAIEDLATVVDWVRTQGFARPHLAGWSWGGRIVARYLEQHPDRVDRLVLMDPALGGNPPMPPDVSEAWFSGGWEYFFARLEPAFTESGVAKAVADYVMQHEPRSPNGIRRENALGTIGTNAKAISRPTLMIYGSAAASANYMKSGLPRAAFFEELACDDKQFIIVPGASDYAHYQKPRRRFAEHIVSFLKMSETQQKTSVRHARALGS